MIRILESNLAAHGRGRSQAFLESVRDAAKLVDGFYEIAPENWQRLVRQDRMACRPLAVATLQQAGTAAPIRRRARGTEHLPRTARAVESASAIPSTVPTPALKIDRMSEPTLVELSSNFAGAMARWAAAGLPTVSADDYRARSAACDACPYWDPKARIGLGRCRAPGCGCTSLKRWLATEQCPLAKWPPLTPSGPTLKDPSTPA